jgi:hypothetical protein
LFFFLLLLAYICSMARILSLNYSLNIKPKLRGFFCAKQVKYCIRDQFGVSDRVRMLSTTFNNITVISWQSVLLVEETRGPGENHPPVTSHKSLTILSHNVASSTPRLSRIQTNNISGDRH